MSGRMKLDMVRVSSCENILKNRITKGKLAVWLATDERVFSVELHLCIKAYCWRESRAKTIASVKCHFKMFSKPLSPFLEPKTNKRVFQSEPEVLPCFELNYKLLEKHKNLFRSRQRLTLYNWPCFLFANAITVLTVDFEMAFWSARSG